MANCINLIKLSIDLKKTGFIIKNNSKNLRLIEAFMKINILRCVKKMGKYLIVYINYYDNKPVFKNVINMYKSSNKKFIKYNELKKINSEKKFFLIISTSKGIVNSLEAVKSNIGGLVLAEIWN